RVHLLLSCFTSALSPSALPFPYPTLFRSGCNRLRKLAGMDDAAVRHHFAEHVYGVPPTGPAVEPSWERLEEGPAPDNGTRRQLRLDLAGPDGTTARLTLLVHLPDGASADAPVPALRGM